MNQINHVNDVLVSKKGTPCPFKIKFSGISHIILLSFRHATGMSQKPIEQTGCVR